ncbi:MAG: Type pilus modification protein PilV [Herminiimonas sp.]|nr:Type pilus modification protein PilV [Herminiimonas sp.]
MEAKARRLMAFPRPACNGTSPGAEAGLSLIEVLVAIFILSIGLLGMLGTMTSSLRLAASSGSRSIAALHLGSIADALRANPAAMIDIATAAANPVATAPVDNCFKVGGGACPQSDAAATIVALWKQSVARGLLRGQATVCRDSQPASHVPTATAGTGTAATAVINWQCDGTALHIAKICWDESRLGALSTVSGSAGFQSTAAVGSGSSSVPSLLCSWTAI